MYYMKKNYFQMTISRKKEIILKRNKIHFKARSWYFRIALTKYTKNLLPMVQSWYIMKSSKLSFLISLVSYFSKLWHDS